MSIDVAKKLYDGRLFQDSMSRIPWSQIRTDLVLLGADESRAHCLMPLSSSFLAVVL